MFPTQEDCIAYLECLRWEPGSPECPHCESTHVRRRKELLEGRIGRYNCHECKSTFKVDTRNTLSRDKDTASEVVFGYLADGKCEGKFVELPVGS